MTTSFRRTCLLGAAWTIWVGAVAAKPAAMLPGLQLDGSVLLPNQWSLRPAGRQIPMGDFPVNIALHPGGVFAALLHSGWGQHEVRVVNLKSGQPVSQVALAEAFYGLAWSADGKTLFASGAGNEVVHVFAFADGFLSAHRELPLRPAEETGVPAGLAVAVDGAALYVAELWGQRVEKISTTDGHALWTRQLASAQHSAISMPEEERLKAGYDPEAPYPYTCVADEKHGRVFVSLWAASTVLVLDASTGAEVARWKVGAHPNEMVLASDGRLFVAESNFNSVSIIDTASGRITETLTAALFPNSPPGTMPNSVALTPDEKTLFVANANNNDIAVFDVATVGRAQSLGFIPVGWFPTSVRVARDGRTLIVANGKGITSAANPRGPFPTDTRPKNLTEYIGTFLQGTLSLIPLPEEKNRATQLGAWTKTAFACSPLDAAASPRGTRPEGSPIPAKIGDASPIKHVIYVIRENRTYDQMLGDMPEGNGAPALCLFGENVTPNAHALSREFVLLDNFFADGEVSADGHEWTMGAYATDFVEKIWPFNYGHKESEKWDYPSEGRYPLASPANGYLWNRAAEAGVSYRSYGEFCRVERRGPIQAEPALPILADHIDPQYRPFDLRYPDVKRAERLIAELRRYETEGDMPRLQVVRLGNDHTEATRVGSRTPTAMVADNDLALGQIVEAVTHSKFWADTAIFILEDDAQNGPDHVDAHRMPALVISQWTKRHAVDSTLYSTTSMLRTIELILGLQPMSQFDAAALPLWNVFTSQPDTTPFAARPAQVDLEAVNAKLAWGARESEKMDFTEPDRVDDIVLNEIVWRSVRGPDSPMPAPVRAAFFKAHPKADDDDL
jgi:6-phosphogluconolactonase (cycloisomerase 2 family)